MEHFFCRIRICGKFHAHVIETLERSHTGGSDGDGFAMEVQKVLKGVTVHDDILGVHLMFVNAFALHRFKSARSYM